MIDINSQNITITPLQKKFVGIDLFKLMNQLSSVPFAEEFIDVNKNWDIYDSKEDINSLVVLFEQRVIGFGTIFIEHKLRDSRVGHIEDIVIDEEFRGKNLGNKLIKELLVIGKTKDCYKTTLNSFQNNLIFYQKLGFEKRGNQMDFFYEK
tara:strand:- start:794 stop:1246 length:453 start_codon:yes stop_codon:yes gene_type:complete